MYLADTSLSERYGQGPCGSAAHVLGFNWGALAEIAGSAPPHFSDNCRSAVPQTMAGEALLLDPLQHPCSALAHMLVKGLVGRC